MLLSHMQLNDLKLANGNDSKPSTLGRYFVALWAEPYSTPIRKHLTLLPFAQFLANLVGALDT
jgi:hypothetical protein